MTALSTLRMDGVALAARVRSGEGADVPVIAVSAIRTPDRRALRWVSRPIQLPSGIGQLTLLADVGAETDFVVELGRFAVTDGRTGLLNRRGGVDVVAREVARARRTGGRLSFFMLDVSGLKQVNRDSGCDAGDRALRQSARAL